ncbi:hypothetical protein BJX70DRAFT_26746 [Aspergillus crustosus]
MPLQLARRGGAVLRILPVTGALTRSVRVLAPQQRIKHISCVARHHLPILGTPGSTLSSSIAGNANRRYATNVNATKTSTTPRKPAAKKAVKKPKVKREPTEKQKAKKAAQDERKRELKAKRREKKLLQDRKLQAKQLMKDLQEVALQPPKGLPSSPWALAVTHKLPEAQKEGGKPMEFFKKAIEAARNASAEEKQRYADQAKANAVANKAAYKAWLLDYTPLQILRANQARVRIASIKGKSVQPLHDERMVKGPCSSWVYFLTERINTAEVAGRLVTEKSHKLSSEWKSLSEAEKKKYLDLAKADKERYVREHTEVYGIPPPSANKEKKDEAEL